MIGIDKILEEWSFRCHDGIVDLNDPKKLALLENVFDEYGIDEEAILLLYTNGAFIQKPIIIF